MSGRSYLSIGDVLTLLRQEFPDITISKIRFLESQGLVNPERTPSGYRKFYEHDVERLRWVLRQQREHFLPLKVIKDRLEGGTDGADEPSGSNGTQIEEATADTPASGVSIEAIDARVQTADRTQADQGSPARADQQASRPTTTHPAPPEPPDAVRRRRPEPVLVGQATSLRGPGAPVSDVPETATEGDGLPGMEDVPEQPSSGSSASTPSMRGPGDGPARRTPAERSRGTAPAPAEASSPTPAGGARSEAASPAPSESPAGSGVAASPASVGGSTTSGGRSVDLSGASLTLAELAAASGLSEEVLEQLCEYGLLTTTSVGGADYFDEDGLAIANLAAGFARFGIEPRHLRLYKNTADREAGFIEQIVLPLVRQRNPEARQRAGRTADELAQLGQGLRSALLRSAIRDLLGG
ncbi:MAG TPA: MerR family transcriptional regulator [Acidimicrobiales bacterium]|nr:MerR family transcriptional regulator [Acidimicrobiales bacterium]